MYLSSSKPVEGKILYIVKGFRDDTGKAISKNIRRLGTLSEIREREGVTDAWSWAKSQVKLANTAERENRRKVTVSFSPDRVIDKICSGVTRRSKFTFDLNERMRQLVLCRIL